MNQISTVIKMHAKDRWSWYYIPWIIVFSSYFINLIIAYFVRNVEPEGVTTGGLISIFVYMFFAGMFVLHQTFAFSLGFSVTRRDYFLGTSAMIGLLGLSVSIVLLILSVVENLTNGWGVNLNFFDMPFLNEMGIFAEVMLYFWTFVHLYVSGFIIACIHRRFGRNGLYVFFIALLLVGSILAFFATYNNWWADLFEWVKQYSLLEIFYGIIWLQAGLSVLYFIISYLFLRRSVV